MQKIAQLPTDLYSKDDIKNEPMVFSASAAFAYRMGGQITQHIIESIEEEGAELPDENLVIDTRVHMLKPGWFPSIPGWHCDAIPRNRKKIPDLNHPAVDSIKHYLCILDFETNSLTEFLHEQPKGLPETVEGENLWGVHSRLIKERGLLSYQVKNGGIYQFGAREYHNTTPATGHGFRLFFRASENTLTRGPLNEARRQVQTYLPYEDLGW